MDQLNKAPKPNYVRTVSLNSNNAGEKSVKSSRFSVSPVNSVDNVDEKPAAHQVTIHVAPALPEDEETGSSEDDEESHDETDQLGELPTRAMIRGMPRLAVGAPQPRSFRRMSSPALSINIKPKVVKKNIRLHLSGNLESLDLKSSLPMSPTFFAKFGRFSIDFL